MEWDHDFDMSKILYLMHLPNFFQNKKVNIFVNQLLVCFHGGCLWLDTKVSVNVHLVSSIIGLPKVGFDPTQFFVGKNPDKHLATRMKEK